jgi:hypothetical protein
MPENNGRTPPMPNPESVEERLDETQAGREALSDVTRDGGGQMTTVDLPYRGRGEVRRGTENKQPEEP